MTSGVCILLRDWKWFQDNGPLRPGRSVIVAYGWLWHDFYLCHARSSLADARADAVRACVATANDKHPFATGIDKLLFRECLSVEDTVLLSQHIEGKVDTFQFTAGMVRSRAVGVPVQTA